MSDATNQCATSFGGIYDFYMERPWLSKLIGRAMWGIDLTPLYRNIDAIGEIDDDDVIADVPCGAGLALRGLSQGQNVRLIGVDLDPTMLDRMREKAAARDLDQVELIEGDMRKLPLADASADHLISFSGLHMINDPERAIAEFARVLKPGGVIIGTCFVWAGARRKQLLWKLEERRGIAFPPTDAAAVESMLAGAGFGQITVNGKGFVNFRAQLPPFHS